VIIVLAVGCASMLKLTSLPIRIQVVDAADERAVANATVELQWRVGFQGYDWGRPVNKSTDSHGIVEFSSRDVPAVSSDGYGLHGPIRKLYITTVIVSAPGFVGVAVEYPDSSMVIRMKKK
jgi:hypothetical protein